MQGCSLIQEAPTRSAPRCLLRKRRPGELLQRYPHPVGALSPSVSPGLLPAQWGSIGQIRRDGALSDKSDVAELSRTSQTAPILSDESDKSDESDGAEYRPAVPLPSPTTPCGSPGCGCLLGDTLAGSWCKGGALYIGHRFADDRCLWSEHPQGVHRRQVWALSDESDGAYLIGRVGRVGQVGRVGRR